MKLVLVGDGQSPHLLKWARALAPRVDLWAVSSRGFSPGWDAVLPLDRRLALDTRPQFEGGNAALLRQLPRLARFLRQVQPDWVHAHYLTSHGTLAWLATRLLGAPGRIVGSAWGSDILVTPQRSRVLRGVTRAVLRACTLTTSDSQVMTRAMQALGAGEVMTFPFGLEALPTAPQAGAKQDHLFFANRGLEPIYQPHRVIELFAGVARDWPDARLVVANDGSLRAALEHQAAQAGLADRVQFVGRLDAVAQSRCYAQARWYISQPQSDSVAVSVLEALAHGCIPILSDLPANHELVQSGSNGLITTNDARLCVDQLNPLLARGDAIAQANHRWVAQHALFEPCVERFINRLRAL